MLLRTLAYNIYYSLSNWNFEQKIWRTTHQTSWYELSAWYCWRHSPLRRRNQTEFENVVFFPNFFIFSFSLITTNNFLKHTFAHSSRKSSRRVWLWYKAVSLCSSSKNWFPKKRSTISEMLVVCWCLFHPWICSIYFKVWNNVLFCHVVIFAAA
jgi:hypothetical protein